MMKWLSRKITRTFSGLLILIFLILVCIMTGAYFYSIQQLEQNNAMLLRLTNQKTAARQIWNDLQETNIEIQEALLLKTPAVPRLSSDLTRTKRELERLGHDYPSEETNSYLQTSSTLIDYYEKILIPLTKHPQSSRYTDDTAMRRMLKDVDLDVPLQSTSSRTERASLNTMYFFSKNRQAADQYISSVHSLEKQAQQKLADQMRTTLWGTLTVLSAVFFLLNSWTFRFMQQLTDDLVRLVKQTKNPYTFSAVPVIKRQDEIGVLGKAMRNMMTMLAFQQSETQTVNHQLSHRNRELFNSLQEKQRTETQLQLQTDFARRLLEYDSLSCLNGLLQDLAHSFGLSELKLTMIASQEEIIYRSPRPVEKSRHSIVRTVPLLNSREPEPFALLTFEDSAGDAYKKLSALSDILSLGILRMEHMRTLNEDKQHVQRILESLREAVIYVNFPDSRLIHNGTLVTMFPELHDLPDSLHEVESILDIFRRVFIVEEQLIDYVTQLKLHLASGHAMEAQDFEVNGNRHIRLYTEFLPDKKGIIFVLSERTAEVEAIQNEHAFISMISHELRTPLASIEGFSELMIQRSLSNDKQLKYLKTVHSEAQRLGKLVTAFLDYQRLSRQKEVYLFESFDISALVQEVADWMNISIPSHQVKFDTTHMTCLIEADREKIRQLLTNLLGNAIKYSPSDPQVDVLLDCSEEEVVLTISDNGLGIPQEDLPHLFDSFYRVERQEHKQIKGTGLGLLICKEIVEAHQGQISVSSELGAGTDFLVRFPIRQQTEKELN
ncbi:hypothetical protein DVG79_07085 [Exiguobacterium sp. RIT594]|nr:hypothetical protein DVG79_07085 [Exiguobacterium sp. RIT594]